MVAALKGDFYPPGIQMSCLNVALEQFAASCCSLESQTTAVKRRSMMSRICMHLHSCLSAAELQCGTWLNAAVCSRPTHCVHADSTLERIQALMQRAAALGSEGARLQQLEGAACQRDQAAAVAAMAAAQAANFGGEAFRMRVMDCRRLGLAEAASAAQGGGCWLRQGPCAIACYRLYGRPQLCYMRGGCPASLCAGSTERPGLAQAASPAN